MIDTRNDTDWSPVSAIRSDHAELLARLFRARFPTHALRANGRIERAVQIITTPGASKRAEGLPGVFEVRSQSNASGAYLVDPNARTCTCPDHGQTQGRVICKHRLAVGMLLMGPDWISEAQAARVHATSEAHHASLAAWRKQIEAVDIWEARSSAYAGYWSDEDIEAARLAMMQAAEIAKYLDAEWQRTSTADLAEFA